jgi:UDP-3-O-[3-hydroxymyristoyl] glucosamine N-acyltransferase
LNISATISKEDAMARMIEELEDETGAVIKYKRHANGRGLVAPTARVADSAYIDATAYVEADARVGLDAYVGAGSWIDRGVTVGDRTFVGANVHVGAGSVVGSGVRIGSNAKLGPDVMVGNGVRIDRDQQVAGGSVMELHGAAAARAALAAPLPRKSHAGRGATRDSSRRAA